MLIHYQTGDSGQTLCKATESPRKLTLSIRHVTCPKCLKLLKSKV